MSFKSLRLILVILLIGPPSGFAVGETDDMLIDKNLVAKALMMYQRDPLDEEGQSAGAIIFMYASKADDIKIALREELVPWIRTADPDDPVSQQLLVAYIAGNVHSQLTRGEAVDDPNSGVRMVLKVYGLLKSRLEGVDIPELEQFVALQKQGKLEEHLLKLSTNAYLSEKQREPLEGRVDFPNRIGAFQYVGTQTYGSPELGISLRYGRGAGQQHYFDLYIYPIPNQALNYNANTLIKSHYRNAKSDIYFAQRKGLIQDVKLNEEKWLSADKYKFPAARGIFELQRDHMLLFSTVYITVKNDHYIKLRATYPKNDATAKGEHMMQIFQDMVEQVLIR
ncbi:MAG: hypothetical protein OEZ68_19070 [Gammaproteobacteria bacterium]|nr:hypothetical protein [Gammaproteobacteria bacterium]MDH5802910.1 hypothetical protein [Gammaproteobacteria bacterium]